MKFIRWNPEGRYYINKNDISNIIKHPDHDARCNKCCSEVFFSHGYLRKSNGGKTICPNDLILIYKKEGYYFQLLNYIRRIFSSK